MNQNNGNKGLRVLRGSIRLIVAYNGVLRRIQAHNHDYHDIKILHYFEVHVFISYLHTKLSTPG
jgi:hypothetical protein